MTRVRIPEPLRPRWSPDEAAPAPRAPADVVLRLQREAGNQAVGRLLQREFNPTQKAELLAIQKELGQKVITEDVALERAKKLKESLTDPKNDASDHKRVQDLIDRLEGKAATKAPDPSWKWSQDHKETAKKLGDKREKLMQDAKALQGKQAGTQHLGADPLDKKAQQEVDVPLIEWEPDPAPAGLRMWAAMVNGLRAVSAGPSLHRVRFIVPGESPIVVTLSTHASAWKDPAQQPAAAQTARPDFLVHDARAELVFNSAMGITQRPAGPADDKLMTGPKDTLLVNYVAFADKLELMAAQLGVKDADLAEWLLMIIRMPSLAPAQIRTKAAKVTEHHLHVLFELATTWMVAEPVRHASSMFSGVAQLELVKAGKRSLRDALVTAHSMAHVGSEGQGRDADLAEDAVRSKKDPPPRSAVTIKQFAEGADLGGIDNLLKLIDDYLVVVQQAAPVTTPAAAQTSGVMTPF